MNHVPQVWLTAEFSGSGEALSTATTGWAPGNLLGGLRSAYSIELRTTALSIEMPVADQVEDVGICFGIVLPLNSDGKHGSLAKYSDGTTVLLVRARRPRAAVRIWGLDIR